MAEKKNKISCYLITLLLLFTNIAPMLFLQKNAYASSAYYNDNIYESSSTYASIDESSNNIIKEIDDITANKTMNTQTVQDGKTKKIYNTIIVKTKKKKKKEEKVKKEEKATEEKEDNEDKEIEKNIDKYIQEEEVEEEKTEKKTKLSKLDTLRYYIDSTRVKRPDPWYLYAAFGYTLGLPKSLEGSAVWDNTETPDERYNSISASGVSRINGWGFTAGIKKYVNRNVFAFYIALETFYNRLALNDLSFQYNTQQQATFFNAAEPTQFGHAYYETNIKIPATISVAPKSVFGGSMRIGLTLVNLISIFGKVNIGGMNYIISSSIDFDNFSMSDIVSGTGTQNQQIKERIVKDWENMYKNSSETFKSMAFTYGFGGGVELTLWNQHLLIRVDYDQFFTSNTFAVDKLFARSANGTAETDLLDTTDKITTTEYGNKWKIKNSFGILKLVVGLSF